MKTLKRIFFINFMLCTALFAEPLSLIELVDIALKNNPDTQTAWWNTKRAQSALGISKSQLYPNLDLRASGNHGREVKFPNGPNTIYTYGSAELCLSYLLFDFGERSATIEATKQALNAANWASDFTIQKVVYKVAAHYYEYLNAKDLLITKESSLCDTEQIYQSADELYTAGLRSIADVSTSKAAVAQFQMDVAQAKAQVATAYGKLMTSLGLAIETDLDVETNPQGMKNPLFSEGIPELIAIAERERADLLAKKATLAEKNARLKAANRAPLPKFRAVGQGGWLEYSKHQGSGYNYNLGLSFEMPVFKGFEYTYRKRLAYADAEMTGSELKELQDEIALEVLTYSNSVKAAAEALKWSDEYLDEATKSYESALDCYRAGLQNVFDLLQTQRYLSDARTKKAQAKTQWLVSLAQLAFATGSILK